MITLQNYIASFIYNKMKTEIKDLEPFFYIAANEKNNSLVFLPEEIDYMQKYFNEDFNFSYRILHFSAKQIFVDSIQKIEKILDFLQNWNYQNDIINLNNQNYKIDLIYINQLPKPPLKWLRPELINLGNESQTYSINLGIKLIKYDIIK